MCCWRKHRHSNEIESTVMKAKTHVTKFDKISLQNGIDKHLEV